MFASILLGFLAAAGAISLGWHPLAIFPVFSLSGSVALVVISLLAAPRDEPLPATATAGARKVAHA